MTRTLIAFDLPDNTPDANPLHVIAVPGPDEDDGIVLYTGTFDTSFGRIVAIGAEGVLWALGLTGEMDEATVLRDLQARFPLARYVDAPEPLQPMIAALLHNRGEVRVRLVGSDFQIRVWRTLLEIPSGQLMNYAELAYRIGQPGAVRAVGTAVGQNPVSWAVPCHRVTRKDGNLGGYHWGSEVKRRLLASEGAFFTPLLFANL